MRLAALMLLLTSGWAHALTVENMSPQQVWDGAAVVVDARVLGSTTRWNEGHTGLETLWLLATQAVLKGSPPDVLTVWTPGGTLDETQQVFPGVPALWPGLEARFLLTHAHHGGMPRPVYRPLGWEQGIWPSVVTSQGRTFVPWRGWQAPAGTSAYLANGMVWPASAVPVQYKVHPREVPGVTNAQFKTAIDAAFDAWANVPCSTLSFLEAGESTLEMAVDGENVMLFLATDWVYGDEAAGATSLSFLPGMQTADVALNAMRFGWGISPAFNRATTVMDVQGVLTHEFGHFAGLSHTMSTHDTMYYSWKPYPGQRTLSLDDKRGICSIYPRTADECGPAQACPSGETCQAGDLGTLCSDDAVPIGTLCNREVAECEDFCLFTASDWSIGYCSRFCGTDVDCPLTHHCADAMAGTSAVRVCFEGPQAQPDAGVVVMDAGVVVMDAGLEVDAGTTQEDAGPAMCGVCPRRTRCDVATGTCTFECRDHADCGAGRLCDDDGVCVAAPPEEDTGGCACTQASGPSAGLWLCAAAGFALRRRVWRR